MFSRLKVRSKLLVMVLPVTLALVVISALGVSERLADRATANRQVAALSLSAQTANFVHQLQTERLLAATAAAVSSSEATAQLEEQQRATDAAFERVNAEIDGFVGKTLAGHDIGRALETIRSLGTATTEVRESTARQTPLAVVEQYSRLIDRATRTAGSVEFADEAGGANAAVVSRRWLAQMIEAESALTAAGAAWYVSPLTNDGYVALTETSARLAAESELFMSMFSEHGTKAAVDQLTAVRASEAFRNSDAGIDFLSNAPETAPETSPLPAEPLVWATLAKDRVAAIEDVERSGLLSELAVLETAAAEADREATWFGAAAAAAILVVALLALAVSRSVTRSIKKLSTAARVVSTEQVPALMDSLRSPTLAAQGVSLVNVELDSDDEFGEVAHALSDLSNAIVEVATEQHQQLRRGISDIFVNLARRNQSLLDRQIQFIDRLETNEEDPDQLENLFRLDHLATRMRRNAESLLVLAGAEAPRRRARNVEIGDVIRVAIGEVEDFARVDLVAVEPAIALGAAAVDIAHLLAELMENGAQYSPPETTVDVVGRAQADGGYCIVITDHGVGMSEERLAMANDLLRNPPPVGLALSRSLGFIVAGTLAERHNITVTLTAGIDGGVIAEVSVPARLLSEPTVPLPQPETRELPVRQTEGVVVPIRPGSLNIVPSAFAAGKGVPGPPPSAVPTPPAFTGAEAFNASSLDETLMNLERVDAESPVPSRLDDRLPSGDAFDSGLYGLLGDAEAGAASPPPALPQRSPHADAESSLPQRRQGAQPGAVAGSAEAMSAESPRSEAPGPAPILPTAATMPTRLGSLGASNGVSPNGLNGGAAPHRDQPSAQQLSPQSAQPDAEWLPPILPVAPGDDTAFLPAPIPGSPALSPTPEVNAAPLPQRRPGSSTPRTSMAPMASPGDAVAPRRTDIDARSALSRYRSGLRTGRNDAPAGANHHDEGDQL